MSIGPLGTNFSGMLFKILILSFLKMHMKISSVKWRPFCPGRDELNACHNAVDNDFVPKDNTPIPKSKLTQIYVAIWRPKATKNNRHVTVFVLTSLSLIQSNLRSTLYHSNLLRSSLIYSSVYYSIPLKVDLLHLLYSCAMWYTVICKEYSS